MAGSSGDRMSHADDRLLYGIARVSNPYLLQMPIGTWNYRSTAYLCMVAPVSQEALTTCVLE